MENIVKSVKISKVRVVFELRTEIPRTLMYQGLMECESEDAPMAEEYEHTPPELKAWVRLPPSAP